MIKNLVSILIKQFKLGLFLKDSILMQDFLQESILLDQEILSNKRMK